MGSEFAIQGKDIQAGQPGYFSRLVKKIVKNIRANIRDLKISIIHKTKDGRVMKLGFELDELSLDPPQDQDIAQIAFYQKNIGIKNFNAYCDTL